jgi:hypothetical protein
MMGELMADNTTYNFHTTDPMLDEAFRANVGPSSGTRELAGGAVDSITIVVVDVDSTTIVVDF